MHRYFRRSSDARRRGSVVAATLGLIILLAFLVVAFMEDARDRIRYHAQFQYRDDLRVEAYSALEATLGVLNIFHEIDEVLWGPEQGWGDPLAFAEHPIPPGMNIKVAFNDESGRLPLNTTERETLRLLFYELGFQGMEQEELTDGLLDWIDEDDLQLLNGFDGEDYRRLRPAGYEPANRPIRSWDEIALIQPFKAHFFDENGLPLPVYHQFRDAFSLVNTGPVNINAATPLVIRVLERQGIIDPYNLQQYRDGPDRKPGTEDDRVIRGTDVGGIFTDPESSLVTTQIELLEVSITVTRGDASFLLRTLVSWRGANASANDASPGQRGATEAATGDEDPDNTRRSRGSARTEAGTAAQLGYPFQLFWIAENRQN